MQEITRKDIHKQTKTGDSSYIRALHIANKELMKRNIPLPSQEFARGVERNISEINKGESGESTAHLREVYHLTKNGIENLAVGMMKGVAAKSAYNIGTASPETIDTGAKETTNGLISMVGAGANLAAAGISGANQHKAYKTGSIFSAKIQQQQNNHERENDNSTSFQPPGLK